MLQYRVVDLQKSVMLEVSHGIVGARTEQLIFGPKVQPTKVEQPGNHRRATSVHTNDTNRLIRRGMGSSVRAPVDLRTFPRGLQS